MKDVIQLLEGKFENITEKQLPILKELLNGEYRTRAQQQINRLEMEATLDPYIAYKLKLCIDEERRTHSSVMSIDFNKDRKYNLMIIKEQRENPTNYTAEETKMVELVKGELELSEEIIPNQLIVSTKRAATARRPIEGISLGGSLKKTKKNKKY
jgi:hypothetical protein